MADSHQNFVMTFQLVDEITGVELTPHQVILTTKMNFRLYKYPGQYLK